MVGRVHTCLFPIGALLHPLNAALRTVDYLSMRFYSIISGILQYVLISSLFYSILPSPNGFLLNSIGFLLSSIASLKNSMVFD